MPKMEIKVEGSTCAFLIMQVGVGLTFCKRPATTTMTVQADNGNIANILPVCEAHGCQHEYTRPTSKDDQRPYCVSCLRTVEVTA